MQFDFDMVLTTYRAQSDMSRGHMAELGLDMPWALEKKAAAFEAIGAPMLSMRSGPACSPSRPARAAWSGPGISNFTTLRHLTGELSETLREKPGSNVHAWGCLTQLSNDMSCPDLTILLKTIDDVGRRLWTSSVEVSPDSAGPDLPLEMTGEKVTESFWNDHVVSFPRAWPETATLAASILDPDTRPSDRQRGEAYSGVLAAVYP